MWPPVPARQGARARWAGWAQRGRTLHPSPQKKIMLMDQAEAEIQVRSLITELMLLVIDQKPIDEMRERLSRLQDSLNVLEDARRHGSH